MGNSKLDKLVKKYLDQINNIEPYDETDELYYKIVDFDIVDIIDSLIIHLNGYCCDYGQQTPNDILRQFLRIVKNKEEALRIVDNFQIPCFPFMINEYKFLTREEKIDILKKMLFKYDTRRSYQIETSVNAFRALRVLDWEGE
jgi:hypothetical protein